MGQVNSGEKGKEFCIILQIVLLSFSASHYMEFMGI